MEPLTFHSTLPQEAQDLLDAIGGDVERNNMILHDIFVYVKRMDWLEAVIERLRVNRGTARALVAALQ
jgi:hypothetical protein